MLSFRHTVVTQLYRALIDGFLMDFPAVGGGFGPGE